MFDPDLANSGIDPSVTIPGWTIEGFTLAARELTYATNFGDPTSSSGSTFSRLEATITIKRKGLRLLFNLFVGFGVAFLLSMLSFLLTIDGMAPTRVALCAAALFGAVGNKYALDNLMPPASQFTLADVIVAAAFVLILMAALTVIIIHAVHRHQPRLARRINWGLGLGTGITVVSVITVALFGAST